MDKSKDIKHFNKEDYIEYISPSLQQVFYVNEHDILFSVDTNRLQDDIYYYDVKGRFRGRAKVDHFLKSQGLKPTIRKNVEMFI